jgi:hypothetical protein
MERSLGEFSWIRMCECIVCMKGKINKVKKEGH